MELEIVRKLSIGLLFALCCTCFALSIYDIVEYKMYWSTYGIYVPCVLLFGFGSSSWWNKSPKRLKAFGSILFALNIGLFGYGIYLCLDDDMRIYGIVTLCCMVATIGLQLAAFRGSKEYMNVGPNLKDNLQQLRAS